MEAGANSATSQKGFNSYCQTVINIWKEDDKPTRFKIVQIM
jgi:hypothetical protein